jgi:predicted ATPase
MTVSRPAMPNAPELFIRGIELKRSDGAADDGYPFSLPALRGLESLRLAAPVTFFVGENGTGKSTLLEAIAVAAGYNAEGGSRNLRFATRATHSELHARLRLVRGVRRPRNGYFLRAESFYNVASEIDRLDTQTLGQPLIDSYGGRSLHDQSHGESFMSLVTHRFSGDGLYLLDEPEAALSPSRQLALLVRMHDLVRAGSQFIIATHSPILLGAPDAAIHVLNEDGMTATSYEDTDHYTVTRRFLEDRHGVLRRLLE